MEFDGVSASVYRGIRTYLRRKGYRRLNPIPKTKAKAPPRPRVVELGPGSTTSTSAGDRKRRRFWRIKLSPRLKLKILRFSPKRFLLGLRDAYVNMMLKIANTRVVGSSYGYTSGDGLMMSRRPIKEYDERMIVEMYKSIVVAQGQVVPRDAAWIASVLSR